MTWKFLENLGSVRFSLIN